MLTGSRQASFFLFFFFFLTKGRGSASAEVQRKWRERARYRSSGLQEGAGWGNLADVPSRPAPRVAAFLSHFRCRTYPVLIDDTWGGQVVWRRDAMSKAAVALDSNGVAASLRSPPPPCAISTDSVPCTFILPVWTHDLRSLLQLPWSDGRRLPRMGDPAHATGRGWPRRALSDAFLTGCSGSGIRLSSFHANTLCHFGSKWIYPTSHVGRGHASAPATKDEHVSPFFSASSDGAILRLFDGSLGMQVSKTGNDRSRRLGRLHPPHSYKSARKEKRRVPGPQRLRGQV
ncbi:hypothetical protein VUR80DRAFT_898 [Thermomyces stellatus]